MKALLQPVQVKLREAVRNRRISDEDARKKLESARETIVRALESFLPERAGFLRREPTDDEKPIPTELERREQENREESDGRRDQSDQVEQGNQKESGLEELQEPEEPKATVNEIPI